MVEIAVYLVSLVVVWGGAHLFVAWRLGVPFGPSGRRVVYGLVAIHYALFPVSMGLRQFGEAVEPMATVIDWVAYIGMGAFSTLFVLMVIREVVAFAGRRIVRWKSGTREVADPERRRLMKIGVSGGLLTATAGATGWGVYQARKVPDVVEVDVPFEDLDEGLEGLRIAQISDLHVGQTIRRPTVEAIAERVDKLDADLIALTGDLIEGKSDLVWSDLQPLLEVETTYGTYFATGNHEYYWDVENWCEKLADAGVEVLLNDSRVIERNGGRLLVAGCTDYRAGRHIEEHETDPAGTLQQAAEHELSLLLAHQPPSIHEAAQAGYDLQLSGHTHGGQFWPWNYVVGLVHPFTAGLGRQDDTWIYVSRGTGYWGPPMRIAAPSEITVLTLREGEPSKQSTRRLDGDEVAAEYGPNIS